MNRRTLFKRLGLGTVGLLAARHITPTATPVSKIGTLARNTEGNVYRYIQANRDYREGHIVDTGAHIGIATTDIKRGDYGWVQVQGVSRCTFEFHRNRKAE